MIKKTIDIIKVFTRREMVITFDKIDFRYTNLSWKKIWNWFLGEISFLLKTKKVWGYPTHIQIEPSLVCNLRCPMCYTTTHNVKGGLMSFDNFKSIMDEVGDYMLFLHFWGWGEPFMNKEIFSMIKYAKNKGIKVITSTNGHFLQTEEEIDKLIDSGLDALIFAMDGADQETYEKYRQNGDLERILKNLKLLVKRKMERGVVCPVVNLRMLVSRENEEQILKMKKLAKETCVDIFTLKSLSSHGNKNLWEETLPTNHEYRRFEYDNKGEPIRKENLCKRMWNHPFIYYDGTVTTCVFCLKDELPVGNVFSSNGSDFSRIWFGEKFRNIRAGFLDFRRGKQECAPVRCRSCHRNYADCHDSISHAFYFQQNGKIH